MKFDQPYRIFSIKNREEFRRTALEIFQYQAANNHVYSLFLKNLGRDYRHITHVEEIAFLPAGLFRSQKIIAENADVEAVFESSTTTGSLPARHYVHDLGIYERSFLKAFSLFYGDPSRYMISALLPSYLERGNSSLVFMMDRIIRESNHPLSGFYKDDIPRLLASLDKIKAEGRNAILAGVSFALLDLAEKYSPDLSGIIVMETGGMKGRRKEMTREELHGILKRSFNIGTVHSEYGMTELMSQAYSAGNGIFQSPPWMKIMIRDPRDPLSVIDEEMITGGLNIIDLANVYSCSFIATDDLGRLCEDGGFEVLGRFDGSDIRGCNLMVD